MRLRTAGIFLAGVLLATFPGRAGAQEEDSFAPFEGGERLNYRLFWPTGILLGEATFEVSSVDDDLHFKASVIARLPQFAFNATFTSVAERKGLCSRQFHQKLAEGNQTSEESLEFDQKAHRVRHIQGRNTTSTTTPECARDPLTFLYYLRSQAAAGKAVDSSRIQLGKEINLQLKRDGTGTVKIGGVGQEGEKFVVHFPTRGGEQTVEIWLSSDAPRTPLQFNVPTTLADFKAELD